MREPLGDEFGVGGAWLAAYTLAAVDAGIIVFDATGRAIQWDRKAADLLRVTEQQLAGGTLHDDQIAARWHGGTRLTSDDDPVLTVIDSGEPSSGLIIGVADADGAVAWRSITLIPVGGAGHATRAALASLTDVTALVESRSIRAAWHIALRQLMRSGLPPTLLIDRDGTILECNDQVLELTDRTELELLDCRFTDICDVDVAWLWDELDQLDELEERGLIGPTSAIHRDGRKIPARGRFWRLDHPDLGRVAMAQLLVPNFIGA